MHYWSSLTGDSRFWLALLAITLVFLVFWLIRARVSYAWKPPLTEREQRFFWRLQPLVAHEGWVLLSQVAFSQFLQVEGEGKARNREWYRWRQKVADFLICDAAFNIIAVIELDDRSHIGKEAQDAERDSVLNQAGIRTLRFHTLPTHHALQEMMHDLVRNLPTAWHG